MTTDHHPATPADENALAVPFWSKDDLALELHSWLSCGGGKIGLGVEHIRIDRACGKPACLVRLEDGLTFRVTIEQLT